eukprot:TRINITY_DN3973_c0_g1_i3.p1 TRINITY_DN3973_c0_g1~~TRINITY_DN3973_c0_g1_i3.p1  ORF type:complete len:234 (-),score=32.85 TRINITY_DN3973_c0_g1_i3:358-1059(-)
MLTSIRERVPPRKKLHQQKKVIFLGDPGVGKTSLLIRIDTGQFPDDRSLSHWSEHSTEKQVYNFEGFNYELSFLDTAPRYGRRMAPQNWTRLNSPEADICYLCFPVNDGRYFERLEHNWKDNINDLRRFSPCAQVLLVGMKADLREKYEQDEKYKDKFVKKEEAEEMVKRLNLNGYFECSGLTGSGIDEMFSEGIRMSHEHCCTESCMTDKEPPRRMGRIWGYEVNPKKIFGI